jgi:glycosyltransferase involved in cell wall biosynthesis
MVVRKMAKVLYLTDSLGFGGAERQLSLLLKYLSPGWETRVISLGGGPYYQVLLDQRTSVAVYRRRSRFDLVPVFRLYSEIVRYKPDIIHSWGGLCSALVAPICKAFRILLIDGSIRIGGASTRHHWRTRITFSLSDHIVANSSAGLSAYQIPAEKRSVVYNAIDPDRLELLKQKSNSQEDITTVIMTGRISPFKDFSSFFQAARRLSAQEPGCWKFVAIGAGEEKERKSFMKLAEDLVVAGVVDLPQAGLEVLPYLRETNVGVLLSASCFKEGISNSIIEYMACELPVVCSDSGGNRELVVDGETGFVIPPEDVDSFIEKLLFLRNHLDISCRMGKAGYKRVISLCSIERMTCEYEAIYTSLLSRSHKRTPENIRIKKV